MELKYCVQTYQDSLYLVQSNKEKIRQLLEKDNLSENDIVDVYISLHIVLEVSLNALHRQIIRLGISKPIDQMEVIKNIDGIGFIDKTILFIYNSQFNFGDKLIESATHHKIIGCLKNFSGIRNKLLHGHSIGELYIDETVTRQSETRSVLYIHKLKAQLKLFVVINNGMRFYLDHLSKNGWSAGYVEDLKNEYLSYDFLPNKFTT